MGFITYVGIFWPSLASAFCSTFELVDLPQAERLCDVDMRADAADLLRRMIGSLQGKAKRRAQHLLVDALLAAKDFDDAEDVLRAAIREGERGVEPRAKAASKRRLQPDP